jgi:hypothetical protein
MRGRFLIWEGLLTQRPLRTRRTDGSPDQVGALPEFEGGLPYCAPNPLRGGAAKGLSWLKGSRRGKMSLWRWKVSEWMY